MIRPPATASSIWLIRLIQQLHCFDDHPSQLARGAQQYPSLCMFCELYQQAQGLRAPGLSAKQLLDVGCWNCMCQFCVAVMQNKHCLFVIFTRHSCAVAKIKTDHAMSCILMRALWMGILSGTMFDTNPL